MSDFHCVKCVLIQSYSGQYFSSFGLNTERYENVELRSISPNSVQMQENTDQNNSEYGHLLCSLKYKLTKLQQ